MADAGPFGTNTDNGLCLDATGGATANGTELALRARSGTADQNWSS